MIIMGNLLIELESLPMLSSLDRMKENIRNEYALNISKELMMAMLQIMLKKHEAIEKGILISDNMIHINSGDSLEELIRRCDAMTREDLLDFLSELNDCGKEAVQKVFDIWRGVKQFGVLCKQAVKNKESVVLILY